MKTNDYRVRLISISNFVTIRRNIRGDMGGTKLAKYLLGGGQNLGDARRVHAVT